MAFISCRHGQLLAALTLGSACFISQAQSVAAPEPAASAPAAAASAPAAAASAPPQQQITVTGYRSGRVVGSSKTDESALDTAQNVQVFSRKRIEEQGARDINDVVRNSPSIGFSDAYGLTIRGFAANNVSPQGGALRQDGLSGSIGGTGATQTLANVEAVEVLKGPNSVLYGAGADGGLINLITKKPKAKPEHSAHGEVGSRELVRLLADTTGPLNDDASLRYRLVAEGTRGGGRFTGYDGLSNRDVFIAPSLEWVGERNNVLLQAEFRDKRNTPTYWSENQPVLNNQPDKQFAQRYFGSGTDFDDNRGHAVTAKWTHTFDSGREVNAVLRRSAYDERYGAHSLGDLVEGSSRLADRSYYDFKSKVTEWASSLYAVMPFDAGAAGRHKLILGADIKRNRARNSGINLFGSADGVPPIDLYAPDYTLRAEPSEELRSFFTSQVGTERVYLQDTISLGERWIASVGVAYDRFSEESDYEGELPTKARKPTKRFGLVYRPAPGQSVFAGYSESFKPQDAFFNTPQQGGPFAPEQGKSLEAGYQWESADKRLGFTGSVYRIEKTNILYRQGEDDPYTPNTVRSQGLELELNGRITPQWSAQIGYALHSGKIVGSTDPGIIGVRQPNSQRHKLNVWTRYDLTTLPGLGFGAGMTLVRDQSPDAFDPSVKMPGFTVFDAALFYKLGNWELGAEVKNLTDRIYAQGASSSNLPDYATGTYGLRRSFRLSAQFSF